MTGQAFALTSGGPRLRIVLKTWSGKVENGEGATVVLVPQRNDDIDKGQTMRCGAGGSFELKEVSPGDYHIAAFDHMDGLFPSAEMLSFVGTQGNRREGGRRLSGNCYATAYLNPAVVMTDAAGIPTTALGNLPSGLIVQRPVLDKTAQWSRGAVLSVHSSTDSRSCGRNTAITGPSPK